MKFDLKQTSFSAGILDDNLSARVDLAKYSSGCRELENFIVQPSGGVYRRPGLKLIAIPFAVGVIGRLIPFQFNVEQVYILLFVPNLIYIFADKDYVRSGGIIVTVATPYVAADINALQVVQDADVLFITHPNYAPRRFERLTATSFQLVTIDFSTPTQDPPTGFTSVWSGSAGSRTIEYAVTAVSVTGEESTVVTASLTNGKAEKEWAVGNYVTLSWTAPGTGADHYTLYKKKQGIYGYIGTVRGATTLIDDNFAPVLTDSIPTQYNPFSGADEYPSCVALHQQRIWFGNSNNGPQTLWASRVGIFSSMNYSEIFRADDSIELTLYSNQINEIQWMVSFGGELLIGSAGAEWRISSTDEGAIAPNSVLSKKISDWGSKNIQPVVIGSAVLYVERKGAKIHDLVYSDQIRGYSSSNLSVLVPSLFEGKEVVAWAYQRSPDSVLWCVLDSGDLLGLTFLKDQQIFAWHKHTTEGNFKSVAVIPGAKFDDVYFLVERESGELNVEVMDDKWNSTLETTPFFLDKYLYISGSYVNSKYKWVLSGSGTSEYYMLMPDNSNPWAYLKKDSDAGQGSPNFLYEDATLLTEATAGSLNIGEWDWADNDSLGFNTVYVRLSDSTDPDSKPDGYVNGKRETIVVPFDVGATVACLLDGAPYTDLVVEAFSILNFAVPAAEIVFGYNYISIVAPIGIELNASQGMSLGKVKSISEITIRLKDTIGGEYGPKPDYLDPLKFIPETYGEPIQAFTGDIKVTFPAGYSEDGSLYIVQKQPLPMTILALIPEVLIEDTLQ